MKFRPGDKVKFMDEPGGGTVTRIDPKGWVYVETEDGFEIPVTPEKLLRTEMSIPEQEDSEPGKSLQPEPEKETEPDIEELPNPSVAEIDEKIDKIPIVKESPAIFLAMIPAEMGITCYLVNDSHYQLFYSFGLEDRDTAVALNKGFLEEETKVELGTVEPKKLRHLFVQTILFAEGRFAARPPLDKQIVFEPEKIPSQDQYKENLYFEEDAWLVSLIPDHVITDIPKTEKILQEKKDKPAKKLMFRPGIAGHEPVEEVDLHIEAIIDEYEKLSPGEILEIQLARFETALEGARKTGQKKIVFIHGLGQGKLKFEIRKYLDKHRIRYQDASFKEYGYGATMVVFK